MGIVSLQMDFVGRVGVTPRHGSMVTTDTLTTITTAGYLNTYGNNFGLDFFQTDLIDIAFDNGSGGTDVETFGLSFSAGVITLVLSSTDVVLPTTTDHIATYTNAAGGLSEDPTLAISGGSIAAGLSGTAGSLRSYPATAAKGYLALTGVANTGNTAYTLSNAASAAARTVTFPDSGQTTTTAILADNAGTQTIATGSLALTVGDVTATAGDFIAGSSGNAGVLKSFPTTALKGNLTIAAVDNTGNTVTTISNAAMGQASVVSIPDPGVATTNFLLADSAGTQTIATGSITLTLGDITASAGDITAGSSGAAGFFKSFPATAAKGSLKIAAVDNTNDDITTISNAAMGQATTISIPDPGVATSNFVLTNSAGTQTIATGSLALTAGSVTAGSSGAAGRFASFPATAASGSLLLEAVDNTGNFTTTISNAATTSANTALTLTDPAQATGAIQVSKVVSDPCANLISFDVTVGQAALATGGSVTLYTSSGSKQYKIRELYVNSGGTNFSGGGGDRLLDITDGTTVYSTIPAASIQTLVNTGWGVTGLPFPASAAINTNTVAGASLVAKYSGGATDYTAGSVVISGILERIA